MTEQQLVASRVLALMDLTSLNHDDTDDTIKALCKRAKTPIGTPAAVCVYPHFVVTARSALTAYQLDGTIKIATVTNFPDGDNDIMSAARETRTAVASGADEVDVVFPYHALMNGDEETGRNLVAACKQACNGAVLKVILETGELKDSALIRRASELALEGGADFLKTSTGKVAVNATLEAAEILLETIKASGNDVGFKAAGGVRTIEDAEAYLQLTKRIMGPGWATPENFRFGASGLLDNLLVTPKMMPSAASAGGDY